ncbi:hypothetical protein HA466_0139210 [Hirschfeldia incana]|nr:hypothetical protein HA466_0139210 [Hirschfeldia incana]
MAMMRSVGSSVANSRIGQFMKRVYVEEVAKKTGETFLVLAGSMGYAYHEQAEEARKIIMQFRKERDEMNLLQKRVEERCEAVNAKKDAFIMKKAMVVLLGADK